MSSVLFAGAIFVVVRFAHGALGGRWLNVCLGPPRSIGAVVILLLVVLSVNQQLHASLRMGPAIDTASGLVRSITG